MKENELPLETAPRWSVAAVYKRRTKAQKHRNVAPILKHWSLRFDGKCLQTAISEGDIDRLREMAKLYNSKKAVPAVAAPDGSVQFDFFAPAPGIPDCLEGPGRTPEEMAAEFRGLNAIAPTPGDKFRLMFRGPAKTPHA